jgi:hypothetical protein
MAWLLRRGRPLLQRLRAPTSRAPLLVRNTSSFEQRADAFLGRWGARIAAGAVVAVSAYWYGTVYRYSAEVRSSLRAALRHEGNGLWDLAASEYAYALEIARRQNGADATETLGIVVKLGRALQVTARPTLALRLSTHSRQQNKGELDHAVPLFREAQHAFLAKGDVLRALSAGQSAADCLAGKVPCRAPRTRTRSPQCNANYRGTSRAQSPR